MDEEQRKQISETLKGLKRGPMSEEHKRKISEAKKGKPKSPEHRAKLSAAITGKKMEPRSEAYKEKMRAISIERNAIAAMHAPEVKAKSAETRRAKLTGRPLSEEHKAKIRAAKQAKPYIYSAEKKAKMSEAAHQKFARMTPEERKGKFKNFIEAGKMASREVICDTKPELIVEQYLKSIGLEYEKQKRISYWVADFYLPDGNTVIEVMGCYWHQCEQCGYTGEVAEERRKKDAHRKAYFEACGYTVQYIWEHELQDYS